MEEWGKILLSALAGMVTGAALEPVKSWLLFRSKVVWIRARLYQDLAPVLWDIRQLKRDGVKDYTPEQHYYAYWWLRGLNFDVFDYFYNTERSVFYGLPECVALKTIYEDLKAIASYATEGEDQKIDYLIQAFDHFEAHGELVHHRLLERSIKRFTHFKPSGNVAFFERLRAETSKPESFRAYEDVARIRRGWSPPTAPR